MRPRSIARWLTARPAVTFVAGALVGRAVAGLRRRREAARERRRASRLVLPSLDDVHPGLGSAPRRRVGVRSVPIERVVGTLRRPSQNTADFLPLPGLRGENWRARWQRITAAVDRLENLPPVDLVKVGDEYWVEDGHNRVAATRAAGAIAIDADVTEILRPGEPRPAPARTTTTSLIGASEVRDAAAGRHVRTSERRTGAESLSRADLAAIERPEDEVPPSSEPAVPPDEGAGERDAEPPPA